MLSTILSIGLLLATTTAIPTAEPAVLKASFGSYGVCKSIAAACGLPPFMGYTASISQNRFEGTCGKCYELTAETDTKGVKLAKAPTAMVVYIDDTCPESTSSCAALIDNPEAKNQLGVSTHFDLCIDSGASQAFFGGNGTESLLVGSAKVVDCKGWKGMLVDLAMEAEGTGT